MNAIFYPAIFHPEETGYSVEIPDIEGCFTQGDTMDEAVRMAQEAIGLMLEDCKVCPEPSVPSALHIDPEDFVVMVPFDMEEYEKRYRPVKKLFRRPSGGAERETPSGIITILMFNANKYRWKGENEYGRKSIDDTCIYQ